MLPEWEIPNMKAKYYTTIEAYKLATKINLYFKMKNYIFFIITITVFFTNSCISQENPPLVSTPDQSKFSTKLIVDGIESPWGMDFISENDFLVTEKKGVLYRVVNGVKNQISGLPKIYVEVKAGFRCCNSS